jgi:hypothetical protein
MVEQVAKPIVSNKPQQTAPAPVPQINQAVERPMPPVSAPQPAKLLTGNLFELLDPSVDVQAEYGISEAELEVLAKKYKEQHLDTPKPEVIRSRHMTRAGLENAERVSRQSFITASGTGKRNDGEEVFTTLFRDRMLPVTGPSKIKTRKPKKR